MNDKLKQQLIDLSNKLSLIKSPEEAVVSSILSQLSNCDINQLIVIDHEITEIINRWDD